MDPGSYFSEAIKFFCNNDSQYLSHPAKAPHS